MKRFVGMFAATIIALTATAASAQYRQPGSLTPVQAAPQQRQDNRPIVKVCTGSQDGVYFFASQAMAQFGRSFRVQPVLTQGSLENVQKVTEGQCDVAFAQDDAIRVYRTLDARAEASVERGMEMYREYVHLLCNRESGITKISQLRKGHVVAIGPEGSGAQVVWQALVETDRNKYGAITTSPKAGIRALMAIQDGSEVTCSLYVGGLGNGTLKRDAQKYADKVVLVNVNEGVEGVKNAKGQSIYTYGAIPNGTYGLLMPDGTLFGTTSASTFTVGAVLIGNTEWIDANPSLYDAVARAVTNALPAIRDRASK